MIELRPPRSDDGHLNTGTYGKSPARALEQRAPMSFVLRRASDSGSPLFHTGKRRLLDVVCRPPIISTALSAPAKIISCTAGPEIERRR